MTIAPADFTPLDLIGLLLAALVVAGAIALVAGAFRASRGGMLWGLVMAVVGLIAVYLVGVERVVAVVSGLVSWAAKLKP